MKRPLGIVDRRFPNSNQTDWRVNDIQGNERAMKSNIDRRVAVSHTFSGTDVERIKHNLGRVPQGVFPVSQSQSANIASEVTKWDRNYVYLKSSVANNAVKLQII